MTAIFTGGKIETVNHSYDEPPGPKKKRSLLLNFVIFNNIFIIFLSLENKHHFAIRVNSL